MMRSQCLRRARPLCACATRIWYRDLKVSALDLRRDSIVIGSEVGQASDRLLRVEDFVRGKAGKGGGYVQVTMRDIHSRNTLTHKFNTGDKVDTAELDNPNHFTLLYEDDGLLYLMEDETMDQWLANLADFNKKVS